MKKSLLIVDDEQQFCDLYTRTLRDAGLETRSTTSSATALEQIKSNRPQMVISDVRMPGQNGIELLQAVREFDAELPFLLVTAYADVRDAVTSLKLGATDYLQKPVDLDELLEVVSETLGIQRDDSPSVPKEALEGIVVHSGSMRAVLHDAWRVAASDITALITGESGSGKEVLARFLHRNSTRSGGPFVPVNCAAMPANLLGSELFGHLRGAFTGATANRKGRFREADGGTLFLDEIGDLPLELQPALLRAIETRKVTPVGSDRELSLDVRLIAATNLDLESAVQQGTFRSDLYYRLNVISLELPALRERREDILPLARHFLAQSGRGDKRLSNAAARVLQAWEWPGNVRELANAMARGALLCQGDLVMPEHLPPALRNAPPPSAVVAGELKTLQQTEIDTIKQALASTSGNRTHAAEILGITRRGLIKKIKRLELEV